MDAGTLKVEAGVATTVRAGDALNRIIEMAGNVDEMIGQIASTSSAQAGAALNSTASLEVISRLSADATAAIPETQQVVDAMEVEVERLRAHISHFQLGATVK